MRRITLLLLFLLINNNIFCQSLFVRNWGAGGNLVPRIRIAHVNDKTDELFLNYEMFFNGQIYIHNKNNSTTKLFYDFKTLVLVEQLKIDYNGNLIIFGRTHNTNLGTLGVYSPNPVPNNSSSSTYSFSFITKINSEGKLVWLTYFHDAVLNKKSLAIDKNNNIYVVSKRSKSDVLSPSFFKNTGDNSSNIEYQDIVSKLDTNGKHIWSTFYFNDDSEISSIVASDNGLYIYGSYFGINSSNNYFSTKNSYQEYPSGITLSNDRSTVFLAKFGFDGKRLWGTYFGDDVCRVPVDLFYGFTKDVTTIGNDVFFLTTHKSNTNQPKNTATSGVYLNSPPNNFNNTTLTRFNGDGKRLWSTYLYSGTTLQKTSQNDLLITSNVENTFSNINNLTTNNAYQPTHGGKVDFYTSIISNDGKKLKYGSFYGYEGNDNGIAFISNNGFYVYGYSLQNLNAKTNFSTSNEVFSGVQSTGYWGYFAAYFLNKSLSNDESNDEINENLKVILYPNPVTNKLYLKSKENLTTNSLLTIYDISGRKVLSHNTQEKNIQEIDVSNLNAGLYILQIEGLNINQSLKFIKK